MLSPSFKRHTASVEPYLGAGTFGDEYGPAFSVLGYAEAERKLVRADTGEETVSEVTFWCDPGDDIPTGSRVTVLGRTSFVLTVSTFDTGGLLHVDHREVALA